MSFVLKRFKFALQNTDSKRSLPLLGPQLLRSFPSQTDEPSEIVQDTILLEQLPPFHDTYLTKHHLSHPGTSSNIRMQLQTIPALYSQDLVID